MWCRGGSAIALLTIHRIISHQYLLGQGITVIAGIDGQLRRRWEEPSNGYESDVGMDEDTAY